MEIKTRAAFSSVPIGVEHGRYSEREIVWWIVLVISCLLSIVTVAMWLAGEDPSAIKVGVWFVLVTLVIGLMFEVASRVNEAIWLREAISTTDANKVIQVLRMAADEGTGPLPALPSKFPIMTNAELAAWCRTCDAVFTKHHIAVMRHEASQITPASVA